MRATRSEDVPSRPSQTTLSHHHRYPFGLVLDDPGGIHVVKLRVISDLKDCMRRQRIVRLRRPPSIAVTLSENELDELIECVANVADRAESAAYNMSGKAKALAQERAKRLYALATRLEDARIDRRK